MDDREINDKISEIKRALYEYLEVSKTQRYWPRSLLSCLFGNKGGLSCRCEGYASRRTVKQLARLRSRDTSDTDDDKAPCRRR